MQIRRSGLRIPDPQWIRLGGDLRFPSAVVFNCSVLCEKFETLFMRNSIFLGTSAADRQWVTLFTVHRRGIRSTHVEYEDLWPSGRHCCLRRHRRLHH